MPFYDVLWHIPYDIKCHKVWQYGYQKNRIDQTNWSKGCRIIFQEQNVTQNPKNWNCNISFVFFRRFLYNFQRICGGVKRSQNQKIFFLLAHTYDGAQKSRRTENLDNFYNFHTALLYKNIPKSMSNGVDLNFLQSSNPTNHFQRQVGARWPLERLMKRRSADS